MKNPKIILAAIGGVTLLALLGLGWFVFQAYSGPVDEDGNSISPEESANKAKGFAEKLPASPGPGAAMALLASNEAVYASWTERAREAASAGDLVFEETTPARCKALMVADARRFANPALYPGDLDGKFVGKEFGFGFKDYVTGSAMPRPADVPRLQREWNDITFVLRILHANKVLSVKDVRMAAAQKDAEEQKAGAKPKRQARRPAAKEEAKDANAPAVTRFTVEFRAKPSAFVGALNALSSTNRFVVVESFTFNRGKDELAEKLGGAAKEEVQKTTSRRRGRRNAQKEQVKKAEVEKEAKSSNDVTDPSTAAPLEVTMTVAVYDFRSLEKVAAEAKAEAEKAEKAETAEKEAK